MTIDILIVGVDNTGACAGTFKCCSLQDIIVPVAKPFCDKFQP